MLVSHANIEEYMEAKDNENKIEEVKDEIIQEENKEQQVKQETNRYQHENQNQQPKRNPILGLLKRVVIVGVLLLVAIFILDTSKYYKNDDITDKTNVIINNNNITARLKQDIIIEDDEIFMSMRDIKNFFDNYIYEETIQNKIITTYDENIAEVYFSGNHIIVNDQVQRVDAVAIERDEEIYLPISEMTNVYNIELEYIEETDIVTIDSIKREQIKAEAGKKISVKDYPRVLSRTVDKVKKGEMLIIISKREDGWVKVRTENGKIGFVKQSALEDEIIIRKEQVEVSQVEGKINMFWDYYSEYVEAPDRKGEEYEGVNVVSPAFFYIDTKGNFRDKVGTAGKEYIKWAHTNGYKVWPMISNAEARNSKFSKHIKSYVKNNEQLRIKERTDSKHCRCL